MMEACHDRSSNDPFEVQQVLHTAFGQCLGPAALQMLQRSIEPYIRRTRLPMPEAVTVIAKNYLHDGARVQELLAGVDTDAWHDVLKQVVAFARRHYLYPTEAEATSWPDLDAFDDIRRKLPTYNFEGSLDSWITVTVLNRLRRFWRDQQAKRSGGAGFPSKGARDVQVNYARPPAPRTTQQSLDAVDASGMHTMDGLEGAESPVADSVEELELQRLVAKVVRSLAASKQDPLLPLLWQMVGEHEWKLREAAERSGLTTAQVHWRITQLKAYLREDPGLREWFNSRD